MRNVPTTPSDERHQFFLQWRRGSSNIKNGENSTLTSSRPTNASGTPNTDSDSTGIKSDSPTVRHASKTWNEDWQCKTNGRVLYSKEKNWERIRKVVPYGKQGRNIDEITEKFTRKKCNKDSTTIIAFKLNRKTATITISFLENLPSQSYHLDDSGLDDNGTYLTPPSKAEAELHKEEILEKIKSLEERVVADNRNITNLLEVQEVGMRKIVLQLEKIQSIIAETRKATKRPSQEQQVEKKNAL
ncbi:hypothetical protein GCK72_015674 [Caenorhabditis remanei]|uniref:Uncharacterized protein n=1 Tax=Caenorhabditis remanei TaxID=31234 RepID=A0A6A5GXU6_CAERE|nr:hypothetical protein GCK72_015674 [Caenorhabditis remanei]KAF1759213.1 hypothetical protein GCK72_015674 [Caenorhabditis remanei]